MQDDDDDDNHDAAAPGANTLIPRAERIVTFYGDPIPVALVDDMPYVALRVLAEYLGLNWAAQYQRTERDEVLAAEVRSVLMTGADGKQREMLGLPLEYLPGWLFGLSPSRVRPALREKVLRYRRYCFKVLWHAVQTDLLATAALTPSAPPQAAAVAEQIGTLTDVVTLLREHLAGLVTLPGQVAGLSIQLDQAVNLLESLAQRQQTTESQVAQIDARTQRLTPAHARAVQELVDRMVRETKHLPEPLTYATIYGRLKHRFRAGSYREIPDDRYDNVIAFLFEELRRAKNDEETPRQGSLL